MADNQCSGCGKLSSESELLVCVGCRCEWKGKKKLQDKTSESLNVNVNIENPVYILPDKDNQASKQSDEDVKILSAKDPNEKISKLQTPLSLPKPFHSFRSALVRKYTAVNMRETDTHEYIFSRIMREKGNNHNNQWVPSHDGVNGNLLILMHGLGDTEESYAKLAMNMCLPQTACVALRAPRPLLDFGYQWFPAFDESTGSPLPLSDKIRVNGIIKTRTEFDTVVKVAELHGYPPHTLVLMGFSQGGQMAMDIATHSSVRLGGVISISGTNIEETFSDAYSNSSSSQTPILVTHGTQDKTVPIGYAREQFQALKTKCSVSWPDCSASLKFLEFAKDHVMVNSKDEMKAIMEFFSENLLLRDISMEKRADLVELVTQYRKEKESQKK